MALVQKHIKEIKMVLREKIKKLRQDKNMTQKEFAQMFDIPYRSYQNYETGITTIPASFLQLLCSKYPSKKEWLITIHS